MAFRIHQKNQPYYCGCGERGGIEVGQKVNPIGIRVSIIIRLGGPNGMLISNGYTGLLLEDFNPAGDGQRTILHRRYIPGGSGAGG